MKVCNPLSNSIAGFISLFFLATPPTSPRLASFMYYSLSSRQI